MSQSCDYKKYNSYDFLYPHSSKIIDYYRIHFYENIWPTPTFTCLGLKATIIHLRKSFTFLFKWQWWICFPIFLNLSFWWTNLNKFISFLHFLLDALIPYFKRETIRFIVFMQLCCQNKFNWKFYPKLCPKSFKLWKVWIALKFNELSNYSFSLITMTFAL